MYVLQVPSRDDKLLHMMALLKLNLLRKKVCNPGSHHSKVCAQPVHVLLTAVGSSSKPTSCLYILQWSGEVLMHDDAQHFPHPQCVCVPAP